MSSAGMSGVFGAVVGVSPGGVLAKDTVEAVVLR